MSATARRRIFAWAGLALSVLTFPSYAQAAPLQPSETIGALRLVHALRGKAALEQIDRLHGKGLASTDAYVAHYEDNGRVAMLYVSRPERASMARAQIEKMASGIRSGMTPFYHLNADRRDGTTVYSTLGQGQIHYFYRRGRDVIWIAADPPVASDVLENMLRRNP